MLLDMDDYSPPARMYWWATALLGAVSLLFALITVAGYEWNVIAQIALGTVVAAATGMFPIRIPGAKTSVAGAEIFVFLILLLYGPAAAAIAVAAEAAVGSARTSARWTSRLGSPAMAGLAMYGCATLFTLAVNATRNGGQSNLAILFGLLMLLALIYFASGTLLMASLISLKRGWPVRPLRMLRDHLWLGLVYAASASISGLLYVSFDRFGAAVLIVAVPIIAMFLSTLHFYFLQTEATARAQSERVAAAEREASETARHIGALKASESRFHSAFTHATIGMMLVAEGRRILQVNPALCALLGTPEASLVGNDLCEIMHPEDGGVVRAEIARLLNGGDTTFGAELRCRHVAGDSVLVSLHGSFFSTGEDGARCLIVQVQDVTARRRAESRLQHIAYHDSLTNLPNRGYFLKQLEQAIAASKRDRARRFAVLFLDFDRFKVINDSLGHRAGDELLVVLARRIHSHLRPGDLVARLGGDEFGILVENLHSDQDAIELADRLQRAVSETVLLAAGEVSTSVSIGITTSTFDYGTPDDAMRDADIAMYRAKGQGKARYAVFDSALHAEVSSQMWLEGELRRAVDRGQFHLAYQPIFDLRTRRVSALEALCRWTHPDRGIIEPARFIGVAEETGAIVPLGKWVMEQACTQLATWQETLPGFADLSLHVNVSGSQLTHPGFAASTSEIIARYRLKPQRVTLEVTESVLIDKLSTALPNLQVLREAGVGLSIDDFGTGYSSLSMLQDLPIGEIKVDRSFVGRMSKGGQGEEVVRAILAMGKALNKRVVAEGIETEAQYDALHQLNCAGGQGYLLAHPMPPGDIALMMNKLKAFEAAA